MMISMRERIRERARKMTERNRKRPSSEELDYLSVEDWEFVTGELWESKTAPYIRLMVNCTRGKSYPIDVREFMGTSHLAKTKIFGPSTYKDAQGVVRSAYVYEKTTVLIDSEDLTELLIEHLPGCNIFGIKNMADRYGETEANFRRLVENTFYPTTPIKYDGAIWAANQNDLDRWFLEAEKRRRDDKERSDENLIRMVKNGRGV